MTYGADLVGLAVHEAERPSLRERRSRTASTSRVASSGPRLRCSHRTSTSAGARQCDLVLGTVADEPDDRARAGRQGLERRGDGGDGRLVADEQVPVGSRVGPVAAARSAENQYVPGRGRRRPRPGDSLVTVHDEVEREQVCLRVPRPHRVATAHRLLLLRVRVADRLGVEDLVVRRALRPEGRVHVGVRRIGHREVLQVTPTERDPHHPGRELLRRRDASVHR